MQTKNPSVVGDEGPIDRLCSTDMMTGDMTGYLDWKTSQQLAGLRVRYRPVLWDGDNRKKESKSVPVIGILNAELDLMPTRTVGVCRIQHVRPYRSSWGTSTARKRATKRQRTCNSNGDIYIGVTEALDLIEGWILPPNNARRELHPHVWNPTVARDHGIPYENTTWSAYREWMATHRSDVNRVGRKDLVQWVPTFAHCTFDLLQAAADDVRDGSAYMLCRSLCALALSTR